MFRLVILCISMLFAIGGFHTSFASEDTHRSSTIFSSSIDWNDYANREKLLSDIPKWHADTINNMFDIYLHPEHYQLPTLADQQKYNIRFINAFWGPLHNPFTRYPRPAKAFIIVKNANLDAPSSHFYMAPIIRNLSDGNDYIFDNTQKQPQLLADWVNTIRYKENNPKTLLFNICTGYGNQPADSCTDKSYQHEIGDTSTDNDRLLHARSVIPSAHRQSRVDWKHYATNTSLVKSTTTIDSSIYKKSVEWQDITVRNKLLTTVTTWPNYNTIRNNFERIRDIRYFSDESKSTLFLRRISWLYPNDGCWTRASAVVRDLFGPINNNVNTFSRPSKVFAFGNLCANTPNAEEGYVTWWYHTAPIVRDAETNQTYVLDPSVNPYIPLPVEKWMADISSQSGQCANSESSVSRFNVCSGYGAAPYDDCTTFHETDAMLDQPSYQQRERKRQISLGRDADKVLGTEPPWSNS